MNDAKKGSPVSTHHLNDIKEKLLDRKAELEEQLQESYAAREAPEIGQEPGDQVQSISLETLKISLQDTELEEYNMIRQALKMIELGSYGICVDCEQPISEKRLASYPNATRCLVCQELLEEGR